ncbi:hypothetical protein D3C75_833160 [compost metagenome]
MHGVGAEHLAADEVALADEAGDEGGQRLVVEVERRVPLLEATIVEHADLVADGEGFLLVVGDQDGAGAARFEYLADLLAEAAAQFDVEVGERLIEQQQARFGGQCAGQGDALLLAAGQLVRVALAQRPQLDQLEHLFGDALALGMLADAEGDVLGHGQVRKQRVVLEHHADAAFFRGQGEAGAGDGLAGQLNAALMDRLETGDGAQGGGLAAAGGAEQATDVACVEVQIEILHHPLFTVAAGQVAEFEQQGVVHGGGASYAG